MRGVRPPTDPEAIAGALRRAPTTCADALESAEKARADALDGIPHVPDNIAPAGQSLRKRRVVV